MNYKSSQVCKDSILPRGGCSVVHIYVHTTAARRGGAYLRIPGQETLIVLSQCSFSDSTHSVDLSQLLLPRTEISNTYRPPIG